MTRISIVTPSYNQAPFLERTILSVIEQDVPGLEYIVVDGGSTDGSRAIIERYTDRIDGWVSEPDRGQTDAINKGFARATGDVIAWLNSDDTYEPGALREALAYLDDHPEIGMVYGEANFIDENDRVIGRFNARQTDFERLMRGAVYVPQQASFFRRELWEQVGPLDPDFYFAMDYDLWVRLSKVSRLQYLPGRVWANFRLHSGAKTIANDVRCWPEMLAVHRREGGSPFSIIHARYLVRRLLAPWIQRRRAGMFE